MNISTPDFDVELLAERAVEMLNLTPGQVVWIWASTHSLDLVEALAFRIRRSGAFWSLRLTSAGLLERLASDLPEEFLDQVPEHELRWLHDAAAIIEVRDHGGHIPGASPLRRRKMGAEWIALIDASARLGLRRIQVANPTPALAAAYGVPHPLLVERYSRALNVDYQAVDRQMRELARLLEGAKEVRITSPAGTDLRLSIAGRTVLQDTDSLPRGEVYVAPLEDSAQGRVVIERLFLSRKPVERLELTFADGRVTGAASPDPQGSALFRQVLEAASGDKDRIAEFAIGLNPGASEPVGDIMLDEKIYGSAHIAIGMNANFGGVNRSNLHLDLVILRPQVWVDGVLLAV